MTNRTGRDNFGPKITKALAERVGYRCSKPDCDVATLGPSKKGGASKIGTAAHITAAAKGGPRYDPTLTSEQRSSADNGIWLCANHGREIDSDDTRYTEAELKQWKLQAEKKALERIGRPQPQEEDSTNLLQQVLGASPTKFLPFAIKNTHRAVNQVLNSLDPRLNITTSYANGNTSYTVSATDQSVSLQFAITGDWDKQKLREQFALMNDHGSSINLENVTIGISGSKALSSIFADLSGGNLSIEPLGIRGDISMTLRSPDGYETLQYPTITGSYQYGKKSGSLKWSLFSELLMMQATVSTDIHRTTISAKSNLQQWENKSIFDLTGFEELLSFFEKCKQSWEMSLKIGLTGKPKISLPSLNWGNEALVRDNYMFLKYVLHVRNLATVSGVDFPLNFGHQILNDEASKIFWISNLFNLESNSPSKFEATVKLGDDFSEQPDSDGKWILPAIRLNHPSEEIKAFGNVFRTPPVDIAITNVIMKKLNESNQSTDASISTTADSKFSILRSLSPWLEINLV